MLLLKYTSWKLVLTDKKSSLKLYKQASNVHKKVIERAGKHNDLHCTYIDADISLAKDVLMSVSPIPVFIPVSTVQ